MSEPRIFQGTPLREVQLKWLEGRYGTDRIDRSRATEVAPGIHVQVMSWGDQLMPDGRVSSGAQIAVWDERDHACHVGCTHDPGNGHNEVTGHARNH